MASYWTVSARQRWSRVLSTHEWTRPTSSKGQRLLRWDPILEAQARPGYWALNRQAALLFNNSLLQAASWATTSQVFSCWKHNNLSTLSWREETARTILDTRNHSLFSTNKSPTQSSSTTTLSLNTLWQPVMRHIQRIIKQWLLKIVKRLQRSTFIWQNTWIPKW